MSMPFHPGNSATTLTPHMADAGQSGCEGARVPHVVPVTAPLKERQGASVFAGRTLRTGLLLAALGLAFSGCGIVRSTAALKDATTQYEEARRAGAAKKARYEYVLGVEYLRKAQEEAGYSDYSTAEKLARQATAFLKKAVNAAEGKEESPSAPEDDAPVRRPTSEDEDLPQE